MSRPISIAQVAQIQCPEDLRDVPMWLTWKYIPPTAPGGKWRKLPYYAGNGETRGKHGEQADVSQLVTFDAARAAAARRGHDGVGFATLPQFGFTVLDFDDCIDAENSVHPDVEALAASSYAEFSVSGGGVHAVFRGTLPDGKSHKASGDFAYGFEVFGAKGFVTFTGKVLPICKATGVEAEVADVTNEVLQLHVTRLGPSARAHNEKAATAAEREAPTDFFGRVNKAAMEALHSWVPSVFAQAEEYSGGYRVGSGSLGRALEEDISIVPAGIVDFGVADMGDERKGKRTPIDLVIEWTEHNTPKAAALFLCERMELAPEKLGFRDVPGGVVSADDFPSVLDNARAEAKPLRFPFVHASEFASAKALPWIIKGVLPQAGLAVVYGASGSGKSFQVLDMGMAIARGVPWRGLKVRQGRVAYVAAEGADGFRKRLSAYAKKNDITFDGVPFHVLGASPNLMDDKEVPHLVLGIEAVGGADVVIVDTFAQTTPGANENAGEDVGRALGHCKRIHEATGALVLLVHHSGKDATKGARGWSGLRAAADAEIEVVREGEQRMLQLTKNKDGEDGKRWGFALEVVEVGFDDDLDAITSCVVVDAELPGIGVSGFKPAGANQKIVYDVVMRMAEVQTVGIEIEAVMSEAVAVYIKKNNKENDTKGNARGAIRTALNKILDNEEAPFYADDDGKTLGIC